MSADRRPPITCHVLDTTVGKPGANIPVTLSLISAKGQHTGVGQPPLTATTNADGRVTAWETPRGCFGLEELFHLKDVEQTYALKFDTQEYFEQRDIKAFFPEVEVRFLVDNKKEHYHVPVLLGPFGYTTYRGS